MKESIIIKQFSLENICVSWYCERKDDSNIRSQRNGRGWAVALWKCALNIQKCGARNFWLKLKFDRYWPRSDWTNSPASWHPLTPGLGNGNNVLVTLFSSVSRGIVVAAVPPMASGVICCCSPTAKSFQLLEGNIKMVGWVEYLFFMWFCELKY